MPDRIHLGQYKEMRFSYKTFFFWIEKAIDEALVEWWIRNIDFWLAYQEHKAGLETAGEHVNKVAVFYIEQRQQTLQAREDRIHAEIEIAAIKLGL